MVGEKLGGRLNMRKGGGGKMIGKKLLVGRKCVKRTIDKAKEERIKMIR